MNKLSRFVKTIVTLVLSSSLLSCSQQPQEPKSLSEVLADQPQTVKSRYKARNPKETLEFFGIEPGMTVVDIYPGQGWYSKILASYLGVNGKVIGADYPIDIFPLFGFFPDDVIEARKSWTETWPSKIENRWSNSDAKVDAFVLGSLPESMKESADAVVMFRALHNLVRFESNGQFLTKSLTDIHSVLKNGGVLGIVQHKASESASDQWANGTKGYLKQSYVTDIVEQAGFELIATSEVNINPKDLPTESEAVWRLPPSLSGSKDNEELRKKYNAIGESSRMTLLFKKISKE